MTKRRWWPPWPFARTPKAPEPSRGSRGGESILFVDNEPAIREAAEELLRGLGYVPTVCATGPEAIALLTAAPDTYALLITDFHMPDMDGLAVAGAAKAVRPSLPVILCTGHARDVGVVAAQEAGITDFFVKPLATVALGRTIRRVLDGELSLAPRFRPRPGASSADDS